MTDVKRVTRDDAECPDFTTLWKIRKHAIDNNDGYRKAWPEGVDFTTWTNLAGPGLDPNRFDERFFVVYLNLRCSELTSLPAEIGQLAALTSLILYGNKLTSLPAEIGQLKALVFIDLSNNELTSLPAELGRLEALKELRLYGNKLTSVPAEIGQLGALKKLILINNRLTSLPAELKKKLNSNGCCIEMREPF